MKYLIFITLLFLRSCEWAPAATRVECDPTVTSANRYELRLGTNSGRYFLSFTNNLPSFVLDALPAGKWFAVITAHNASAACDWSETSDRWDDPSEISFTNTVPSVDVTLQESTNLVQWTSLTTVRVPVGSGPHFYRLLINRVGEVRATTAKGATTAKEKTSPASTPSLPSPPSREIPAREILAPKQGRR